MSIFPFNNKKSNERSSFKNRRKNREHHGGRSGVGSSASSACWARRLCFMMALMPGITLQFMYMSNKVIIIERLCGDNANSINTAGVPISSTLRIGLADDLNRIDNNNNDTPLPPLDDTQEPDSQKNKKNLRTSQQQQQQQQQQQASSFSKEPIHVTIPSTTSTAAAATIQRPPIPTHYKPYHLILDEIKTAIELEEIRLSTGNVENSYSVYFDARHDPLTAGVSSWPRKRKQCRSTCCVETVPIPLAQDEHRIINTEDGKDMADLWIQHLDHIDGGHLPYFAASFNEKMIPCLVPGTIIQIDNHQLALKYFWGTVRPKMQGSGASFLLVTTASDDDTPALYEDYLYNLTGVEQYDPLLLKWYGTNPYLRQYEERQRQQQQQQQQQVNNANLLLPQNNKLRRMHLGLSYQHPQSKYLTPYMKLNDFRNPFENPDYLLDRYDFDKYPFDFERDIFVHFGIDEPHRQKLWNVFCANSTTTTAADATKNKKVSCDTETRHFPTQDIYQAISQGNYRFGISPTGVGWDCYRTYEYLLLGIIPIINERIPDSYQLYDGFPVIHMPNLDDTKSKNEIETTIRNYITNTFIPSLLKKKKSTTTTTTTLAADGSADNKPIIYDFTKGWERMFMKYQRRQLLRDTGREKEIFVDEVSGKEYYQGYRYTILDENTGKEGKPQEIWCSQETSCLYTEEDANLKREGWGDHHVLPAQAALEQQEWLDRWQNQHQQQ